MSFLTKEDLCEQQLNGDNFELHNVYCTLINGLVEIYFCHITKNEEEFFLKKEMSGHK